MPQPQEYTLSNLMDELNLVIRSSFDKTYWVVAEVANVSSSPRGHMYFELVEKVGPQIIAKARANLWSSKKHQIITAFEDITRQTLKNGMKVLLQLSVEFHAVYGISFQIHDIDPSYSLGELERQKQETIKRLTDEGLLDFNKQYVLNSVIQKIAIISSETAAGYQDFTNQLESNKQSYTFQARIFPAIMQGEQAVESIIKAVEAIESTNELFDAIIVIRGGGSNLDLACFDDYLLASRLAQAYFPVLTGIGHERDQSVTDMIAHTRLKTPTAVAEFIIQYNDAYEQNIIGLFSHIADFALYAIDEHKSLLVNSSRNIVEKTHDSISSQERFLKDASFFINKTTIGLINNKNLDLREQGSKLSFGLRNYMEHKSFWLQNIGIQLKDTGTVIKTQQHKLAFIENTIKLSNPDLILKKGFSITRKNGNIVSDASMLTKGDIIETEISDGKVKSRVESEKWKVKSRK